MPRLPRNPNVWLAGFLLWFGVLWAVSSFKLPGDFVPPVKNFDKIEHFGYFFGGSGLLCAWLYRRRPERPEWAKLITAAVVVETTTEASARKAKSALDRKSVV